MKTRIFVLAAAIALMAASCQKINIQENLTPGTQELIISTSPETKTSLAEDGSVNWTADDEIAVFDNANVKNKFDATVVNGARATFSGNITVGSTQIFAVYPYELAIAANSGSLTVNIPVNQSPEAGTFAEEHNISVAKATKEADQTEIPNTVFKNVCALLKFTIPSYIGDASKVTITSDKPIAGNLNVDYSGDSPVSAIAEDGSNEISMVGEFLAGSTFWFVLAPTTLNGLTVDVETARGVYTMSTTSEIKLTAGQYKNLGTLELKKALLASATAAHVYSDNVLTGTEIQVNLNLDETTAAYISKMEFEVVKRIVEDQSWWEDLLGQDNARDFTIYDYDATSIQSSIIIPPDTIQPFLPTGEYVLKGTYELGGVEHNLGEVTFVVNPPFTAPDEPSLEVTEYNVYTSYTKYAAGDVSGANALNGSAIYAEIIKANISDDILDMYGKNAVLTFNFEGDKSISGEGYATVGGSEFGTYVLESISASFNGSTPSTTAEGNTYHITGIPFNYDFTDTQKAEWTSAGWTINGNVDTGLSIGSLEVGGATLHRKIPVLGEYSGFLVSPRFALPESISIKPTLSAFAYDTMVGKTYDYNVFIGNVSAVDEASTAQSAALKTTANFLSDSINLIYNNITMDDATPYVSISSNKPSATLASILCSIYNVSFEYAE